MDSKLQKMAISASLGVILLVALVILYTNWDETAGSSTPVSGIAEESTEYFPEASGDLKEFLNDPDFFDSEENETPEIVSEVKELSMIATSVEKDLRVQIVDLAGTVVEGESFYVSLSGLGEFKDLDKDGIIYIGDLDSGEYNLKLLPIEGYAVPGTEMSVRVKDKVEYLAIEDISLLIKTEDEVDEGLEDTAQRGALTDADNTEIKELQNPGGRIKAGIDVSKWNGDIDWGKVKNAGVEFAIVRAGYRGLSTGSLVEDPCFKTNMQGAASAGLEVGVYFFSQAVNEVEAVEEASAVLKLIREYELDYPIFIDSESTGRNGRADGLDVETRTLVCEAFCRTIENAGYEAGVYANRNWYNNNLIANRLESYYIWLAEYRSIPLYEGYYNMWQYTSSGKIDGIDGNVDFNIAYE